MANQLIDWRRLVGAKSRDEALAFLASKLEEAGSVITNFNVGGVWRTFLEVSAQGGAKWWDMLAGVTNEDGVRNRGIVEQGFAEFATGPWLDLHLRDAGIEREQASIARLSVKVTVDQETAIPVNRTVITSADDAGEVLRFYVETATTISPPHGFVTVRAQAPGRKYNVGTGRIESFEQPIAGVTAVTNEADAIIDAGTNREGDDRARKRRRLAWRKRASGSPAGAYEAWIYDSSEDVAGVAILANHPRGRGSVDGIVVGETGIPSDELIATVQAYVDARRSLTADFLARKPTERSVDVVATVYCHPLTSDLAAIEAEAERRIRAIFEFDESLNLLEKRPTEFEADDTAEATSDTDSDTYSTDDSTEFLVPLRTVGEDLTYSELVTVLRGTTGRQRLVRDAKVWDAVAGEPTLFADLAVAADELTTLNSVTVTAVRKESL